jgi:hypothetical protein
MLVPIHTRLTTNAILKAPFFSQYHKYSLYASPKMIEAFQIDYHSTPLYLIHQRVLNYTDDTHPNPYVLFRPHAFYIGADEDLGFNFNGVLNIYNYTTTQSVNIPNVNVHYHDNVFSPRDPAILLDATGLNLEPGMNQYYVDFTPDNPIYPPFKAVFFIENQEVNVPVGSDKDIFVDMMVVAMDNLQLPLLGGSLPPHSDIDLSAFADQANVNKNVDGARDALFSLQVEINAKSRAPNLAAAFAKATRLEELIAAAAGGGGGGGGGAPPPANKTIWECVAGVCTSRQISTATPTPSDAFDTQANCEAHCLSTLALANLVPTNIAFREKTPADNANILALYRPLMWGAIPTNPGRIFVLEDSATRDLIGTVANISDREPMYIIPALATAFANTAYQNYGIETGYVTIADAYRGGIFLSELFYNYLNIIDANTWLWTDNENTMKRYKSYGFDVLYRRDPPAQDPTNPLIKTYNPIQYNGNYQMIYMKPESFTTGFTPNGTNFVRIPCANQNLGGINYRGSCGIFVTVNALVITYLSKFNPTKLSLLNDQPFIFGQVQYMKYIILKYLQYVLHNSVQRLHPNDGTPLAGTPFLVGGAPIFDPYAGLIGTLNMTGFTPSVSNPGEFMQIDDNTIRTLDNFNPANHYIQEALGILEDINDWFHWNIPLNPVPVVGIPANQIYLNMDWLNEYVIFVQDGFDGSNPINCRSVLFKSKNNKIIKNFYRMSNYIVTFIIGNNGHWKCYTVNKVNNVNQYLFLSSISEGSGIDISNKIRTLLGKASYEQYVIDILKCYTAATANATYNTYIQYLDTMIHLLLTDSVLKKKIPNYNEFVKKIITRIISIDMKYLNTDAFYIDPTHGCERNILTLDEIIQSSDPAPDILTHYYTEIQRNRTQYNKKCFNRLYHNTQIGVAGIPPVPVRGGSRFNRTRSKRNMRSKLSRRRR